jgi:PAS domain S-box-containing protein/putative nucleotidyltransferase with HDIG domain
VPEFTQEYRLLTKTGEVRWVEDRTWVRRDEAGNITHYQGIVIDITERKQAEQAFLEEKLFSDTVIDSMPGVFYVFDEETRLVRWNRSFAEISGYYAEEISRLHALDVIAEADRGYITDRIGEVFSKGSATAEANLLTKSGNSIPYFFTGLRAVIGGKTYLVGMAIDIAERKRAEEQIRQSLEKFSSALMETVNALAATVESRDPYTAGHQQRVARLACAIARRMGLPDSQLEEIRVAAIVHDIGKINIPVEILNKPGHLTDSEMNIIKEHPKVAYEILKKIPFPWPVAQIALQHHERINGSGYPAGLKGEEMLLEAKIIAVADVVEAMSTHRPFRPAKGIEEAGKEILQGKGVLYDPAVVEACLQLFETGELVAVLEGETAPIMER